MHDHGLDPQNMAGIDLGIIHPFAAVADGRALLVSGRALRAEERLHLEDTKRRHAKTSPKAPTKGQRGLPAMEKDPRLPAPSRGTPPTPRPPRASRRRQPGSVLGRRAQGRHARGRRSRRDHPPQRRTPPQPSAAPVAAHAPATRIARQSRARRHPRHHGGRARNLLHLPALSHQSPQTQRQSVRLHRLRAHRAPRPRRRPQHRRPWRRDPERTRAHHAPSSGKTTRTA